MKKVVIVILNWNKWQDTIECLNSVYNSDYSNYEVLLIDNGSSDGSVVKIRNKFPDLRMIVNSENIGFTGGNNQGMRLAVSEGADYVWLLNNDTEVESDCLSKIVSVADSRENIGLVSPAICYFDEPEIHQFKGSVVDWDKLEIIYPNEDNKHLNIYDGDSVCLWGTALLINVNLIKKIGYLNEDYFAYYEDTAYSLRSIINGFRNIYYPIAKILHKHKFFDNEINIRNSYYYYYMIRNEYFLWKDVLRIKSCRFLFKKIALKAISHATRFQQLSLYQHIEANFQGLFDAMINNRGKLIENKFFDYKILKFCLYHPYFLLNFFLLDFQSMIKQIKNKL